MAKAPFVRLSLDCDWTDVCQRKKYDLAFFLSIASQLSSSQLSAPDTLKALNKAHECPKIRIVGPQRKSDPSPRRGMPKNKTLNKARPTQATKRAIGAMAALSQLHTTQ